MKFRKLLTRLIPVYFEGRSYQAYRIARSHTCLVVIGGGFVGFSGASSVSH